MTSRFGKTLALVKIIALIGGFCYARIFHLSPSHGGEAVFWGILVLLILLTGVLYSQFGGTPEQIEKQYLLSLAIDLAAIAYLFLLHPQAIMAMLVGLAMICGFYSFVLPRTSGTLVWVLAVILYSFPVLLGWTGSTETASGEEYTLSGLHSMALLVVGITVLSAVVLLVKRIREGVDTVYKTSNDLAFDLARVTVEAELQNREWMARHKEVQTLLEILGKIVSVLEWEELFDNIVAALRNRFAFDKACIYLYESDTKKLVLSVESGGDRATGAATSLNTDQGVVGWCFTQNKGLLIPDVRQDPRYKEFNERGRRIRSLACQPLVFRGQHLGVLCLDSESEGSIDEDGFQFLKDITPLMSVAVSNSLSYHMVKTESSTDSLTGIYNHRGFMEQFLPTLELAIHDEVPLALLIMDIDNFKKINDTYGHLVGNIILTELADILTGYFRSADLIARWGGEEFVVVLKGTPPSVAPRICDQLRRKIESHQFPISQERDAFRQVTVSLGLATSMDKNLKPEMVSGSRGGADDDVFLRNVAEIADQIVKNADEAMYAAKRAGKNQLMISLEYPVTEPQESPEH